jgi:hypothetical protein
MGIHRQKAMFLLPNFKSLGSALAYYFSEKLNIENERKILFGTCPKFSKKAGFDHYSAKNFSSL